MNFFGTCPAQLLDHKVGYVANSLHEILRIRPKICLKWSENEILLCKWDVERKHYLIKKFDLLGKFLTL